MSNWSKIMITEVKLPRFNIIYAEYNYYNLHHVIGSGDWLPTEKPVDSKHFISITNQPNKLNIMIVGRNTYEGFLKRNIKFSDRILIVVSTTLPISSFIARSLDEALGMCIGDNLNINVIGGKKLYEEALRHPCLDIVYKTIVYRDESPPDNPVIFYHESYNEELHNIITDDIKVYTFNEISNYEMDYINLIKRILKTPVRPDRTGVGCHGVFSAELEVDLTEGFPLLTGRRISLRLIFEELMWFIRGQTDAKILQKLNVNIWNGNTSKEFIEKRGLNYTEGQAGPIYGHQWRHWGGDQLMKVIDTLWTDPFSRRHIVSAWNVEDLDKMVLPPCHFGFQFYVSEIPGYSVRHLSCKVFMRSTDVMLGLPFNVASYSLLTIMIAQLLDMVPYKVIITMTDAHIYTNHLDGVNEYLNRTYNNLPTLEINKHLKNITDIENLKDEDIILRNYYPNDPIKMNMVA